MDEYHKDHKQENYVYRIHVEGMKCGACEAHIKDTIRQNFPVRSVCSSRNKNETIIISKNPLDVTAIKRVIGNLGYRVS